MAGSATGSNNAISRRAASATGSSNAVSWRAALQVTAVLTTSVHVMAVLGTLQKRDSADPALSLQGCKSFAVHIDRQWQDARSSKSIEGD